MDKIVIRVVYSLVTTHVPHPRSPRISAIPIISLPLRHDPTERGAPQPRNCRRVLFPLSHQSAVTDSDCFALIKFH